MLQSEDVNCLVDTFLKDCPKSVLVPTYEGRRGNPIVLDSRHRDAILAGDRNLGCKRLIEKNPELVFAFPMPNDHCVVDLDSPDDYASIKARADAVLTPPAVLPDLLEA